MGFNDNNIITILQNFQKSIFAGLIETLLKISYIYNSKFSEHSRYLKKQATLSKLLEANYVANCAVL